MANHSDQSRVDHMDFKPIKILDLEISQPLPEINSTNNQGLQIYQRVLILVRLHSLPIGLVEINFPPHTIPPVEVAVYIWAVLGEQINRHLQQDELPIMHNLPAGGLPNTGEPACLARRWDILNDAPLISVILATRDRVRSLANTLNSLFMLDYPRFEIILVDNAPASDETHDFFIQCQDRFASKNIGLHYVREDIPGLAVAHNRGLEAIHGSIAAFTDDDVVVDRLWLAEIAQGFKGSPDVGCVTGLVIPLELRTPAQVLFEEFGGFTKGFTPQVYDLRSHQPGNPLFPYAAGRFGTGANMAFSTNLLQKVGGFDPALGIGTPALGADDMAAFFSTLMQGRQLVYQPSALVFHQHRTTYEGLRKQMFGYGVGLTAFLTKCMVENPRLLPDISRKIPAGIIYALSPGSEKNQHKSSNYPHELERIERLGMLYGPIAYLRSRWQYRKAETKINKTAWRIHPSLVHDAPLSGGARDYHRNPKTK